MLYILILLLINFSFLGSLIFRLTLVEVNYNLFIVVDFGYFPIWSLLLTDNLCQSTFISLNNHICFTRTCICSGFHILHYHFSFFIYRYYFSRSLSFRNTHTKIHSAYISIYPLQKCIKEHQCCLFVVILDISRDNSGVFFLSRNLALCRWAWNTGDEGNNGPLRAWDMGDTGGEQTPMWRWLRKEMVGLEPE